MTGSTFLYLPHISFFQMCYCHQKPLCAFLALLCGVAMLHVGLLTSSLQREHLGLVSGGWEHCRTEKGQLQNHSTLLRKCQLHPQLVEVGLPHQTKGAPAWESRTGTRLVSPATGYQKKKKDTSGAGPQNTKLSTLEILLDPQMLW